MGGISTYACMIAEPEPYGFVPANAIHCERELAREGVMTFSAESA